MKIEEDERGKDKKEGERNRKMEQHTRRKSFIEEKIGTKNLAGKNVSISVTFFYFFTLL